MRKGGGEIKGSKAAAGFEGQDKELVLDKGLFWEAVEICREVSCDLSGRRGR